MILNFPTEVAKVMGGFFVVSRIVYVCIGVECFLIFIILFLLKVATFLIIGCVDIQNHIQTRIKFD